MTDEKFLEKAGKFHIMEEIPAAGETVDSEEKANRFYTLEEYRQQTEAVQKNKDGKLIILYSSNPVQQDAYVRAAQTRGYRVVKMETLVDAAFINQMEMKWNDVRFTRVDADIADNLIDTQENSQVVLGEKETEQLKSLFDIRFDKLNVSVDVKGLSPDSAPVIATRPEFMRRMKDMASVSGDMGGFYASMPDEVTLTVNGNHPIFQQILKDTEGERQAKTVRNLADLALLSQGLLKGNDLTQFINRSVELMEGSRQAVATDAQ
jgi:molecular chaperone HtpG